MGWVDGLVFWPRVLALLLGPWRRAAGCGFCCEGWGVPFSLAFLAGWGVGVGEMGWVWWVGEGMGSSFAWLLGGMAGGWRAGSLRGVDG